MSTLHLDVLFRSCSRVDAVHGGPRRMGVKKSELIRRCLASLLGSIEAARDEGLPFTLTLTVIDDHSEAELLAQIEELLASRTYPARLVPLAGTGNGASLLANYEFARAHCEHLIYFVEDDYLHAPEAIADMLEAISEGSASYGADVVVFPCDYPDRYDAPYPSLIFRGRRRYWRTVRHSTGTFLLTRAVLDQHWEHYRKFADIGIDPTAIEDSTINKVYAERPCVAPMPSLTVHLHDPDKLSPFVPWRLWWDAAGGAQTPNVEGSRV